MSDLNRLFNSWDRIPILLPTTFDSLRNARIFMTGGPTVIGYWLLSALCFIQDRWSLAMDVTVLVENIEAFHRQYPSLAGHPSIHLVLGKSLNFNYPKGKFSHLIHAEYATLSPGSERDSLVEMVDTIVDGSRRVLELAITAGVKQFLLVSSEAIYGTANDRLAPIAENDWAWVDPLDPHEGWAAAKRLVETLTILWSRQGHFSATIGRCFGVMAPCWPLNRDDPVAVLIDEALHNDVMHLTDNENELKSYLYIGDCVLWLLIIMMNGQNGQAYNVGSDQPVRMHDLAYIIRQLLSPEKTIVVNSSPLDRHGQAGHIPSIKRASSQLGLLAWTPLEQAIVQTAHWYQHGFLSQQERVVPSLPVEKHKTFVMDIDGVIASLVAGNDYAQATPILPNIAGINRLYHLGHRIVLFTARGSMTGIDWQEVTQRQMEQWGVKFHQLCFGKPAADYYVDDRLLTPAQMRAFGGEPLF